MQQLLHLLIVAADRRAALAATFGSRWLLPVVTCAERVRSAPLVARWLMERGFRGGVAGQWLGRVSRDATDWLVPIVMEPECVVTDLALEWRPLDALAVDTPVVEYQQWALARTLARGELPSVEGPFGHVSWPDEVRAWIGAAMGSAVTSLTPYRVGAHEVVLGADCACGRVYFKGLAGERATEARLTQALAQVAPDSFARTLALEQRADDTVWWLAAACPGQPGGDAHRAAETLARIQQCVLTTFPPPELAALDLEAAATWAGELLGESPAADVVRQQCARVTTADVPATWMPMDLDPTNILEDDEGSVRFIDVDDSFLGPAPLAIAVLAARCGERTPGRTYERSWSPSLADVGWPAFETAAMVVRAWLGWRRLERNVARGEVYIEGDLAAERTRQRLARAIAGLSPCRSRPGGPGA